MTDKEKINFIDETLATIEDYVHGEDGENITLSRKYLEDINSVKIKAMFKNEFTGISDIDGNKLCEGMTVEIIDKKLQGVIRYSFRRAGFRIFMKGKPQEAKTYSVANSGSLINNNLKILK